MNINASNGSTAISFGTSNNQASGLLEDHPDLTPVYAKTIYTEDAVSESDLRGSINAAILDVVQTANEDGRKNVVTLEANFHEGIIGVVSYAANQTSGFKQGDNETVENVLSLQVMYVDEDGSDDNQQIRFNTQPGKMLANDPNLTPVRAKVFSARNFSTEAELRGAAGLEAFKVMQQAATDGKQNVITLETNTKSGSVSVVNYEALNTSDYTQGEVLTVEDLLHIEVLSVDTDTSDDLN